MRSTTTPKKKAAKQPYVVSNRKDVAAFFGVTVEAIHKWRSEGMPGAAGRFALDEIAKWRIGRLPKVSGEGDPEHDYRRHRAELMRIRLEEKKATLIEVEVLERLTTHLCIVFKAGLLGMMPTLASQLEGLGAPERLRLLNARAREILENVSLNVSAELQTKGPKRKRAKKRSRP